ncbi:hypothetical protein PF005_g8964 [Phytophthora fragariae]|uniref:Uncharacterized protein n=1 Tax=Phytophthora fragariae TaxID=53985 RepID=A0A6A3F8S4_9STRA|nr:hypothetical protein PF009_g8515 [Phytophthora fragariae]KAE9014806.1 hypothetical protein PF011_g7898 [Phytophthora fragariae]KAE9112916.1 hypothetical protein PF010_g10277 [Phytophthora fragariae]KAE9117981.1 hypothetical protein PF007_g9095 [Phytophthora fragariae]KAE9144978.1 hypothetical protein PF006_g10140 [Phytophthora fragariae]
MVQLVQDIERAGWGARFVPFLSPPNEEWPEWLKDSSMRFDNLFLTPNEDGIDFRTTSNLISGECKDRSSGLDLDVIRSILKQYFTAKSSWETVDFYRISKGSTLQGMTNLSSSTATKAEKLVLFIELG